ncbi:MAG: glycoside hydrolase [Bryobacterales bacterium]|nr:glycoside hydrolase [Bryobacterales bacterium]
MDERSGGRNSTRREWLGTASLTAVTLSSWAQEPPSNPPVMNASILPLLPPGPGNPRNTEGAFITLRDGRILFAYTKFSGGHGDHDSAILAGRFSNDSGQSWSASDVTLVANEGAMNVMSVSLLRLHDGRIALFYLRKNSVFDCKPFLRTSGDEGAHWSDPVQCVFDPGYWVLNNDRVVQLASGRLLMPLALHLPRGDNYNPRGIVHVYYSDDQGATWRDSKSALECPTASPAGLQEPGIVALKDGRLLMFIRTRLGCQYRSYSEDQGVSWSPAEPSPLLSPLSPASIKRIPSTGDLLAVWNDHSAVPVEWRAQDTSPNARDGRRTPLTLAISRDEGRSWTNKRNLLASPNGWYCYTAIHFVKDHVLLGYVSGGDGLPGLSKTDIARVPIASLYADGG